MSQVQAIEKVCILICDHSIETENNLLTYEATTSGQ